MKTAFFTLILALSSLSAFAGGGGSWNGAGGGDAVMCFKDVDSAKSFDRLVRKGQPIPDSLLKQAISHDPLDLRSADETQRISVWEGFKLIFNLSASDAARENFTQLPEARLSEPAIWAKLDGVLAREQPLLGHYLRSMRTRYPISSWTRVNSLREIHDELKNDHPEYSVAFWGFSLTLTAGATAAMGALYTSPFLLLFGGAPVLAYVEHNRSPCVKYQLVARTTEPNSQTHRFYTLRWTIDRMNALSRVAIALHEYLYTLAQNPDCMLVAETLNDRKEKFLRKCRSEFRPKDSRLIRPMVSQLLATALDVPHSNQGYPASLFSYPAFSASLFNTKNLLPEARNRLAVKTNAAFLAAEGRRLMPLTSQYIPFHSYARPWSLPHAPALRPKTAREGILHFAASANFGRLNEFALPEAYYYGTPARREQITRATCARIRLAAQMPSREKTRADLQILDNLTSPICR